MPAFAPRPFNSYRGRRMNDNHTPSNYEHNGTLVRIDYTNWKGERRERWIRPIKFIYGSNQWHIIDQWLVVARDYGDDYHKQGQIRTFAINSPDGKGVIHKWTPWA